MCIFVRHHYGKVYYISRFLIGVSENMSMEKLVAGTGIAVAIIVMVTTGLALLLPSTTVNHTGTIQALNLGVYSDSACTQTLSLVNWGALRPGTSANYTIYVKNTGNALETLNMTVTSWNPAAASSYMTLTWNQQNAQLAPGFSVPALLVLSVASNVTGFTDFNCTTIISGQ
jgi:hypothetical protein